MSVRQILDRKGSRVNTVHPETPVSEVVDILATNKIGALVVTDDAGNVRGIISERDVVRELAGRGPSILRDPTARHMTRHVVTCRSGDAVDDILSTMTTGHFRHMPVVDNGILSGIVTLGDLIHFRMQILEREATDLRSYIAAG